MKLESTNSVILNSSTETQSFKIDANRKMFEILSSKIYKYKIAAIVREISCNAYDSHIEAGIEDTPFEVTLPTDMYPYFEIQDFGVGLDENQVLDIYTAYGSSTKTNTNLLTGGFGLGSKTPFAYTTSFNIITVKDNVEYIFNAYMDENGPAIAKISAKKTDKHNGVIVKIPVATEDFNSFKYEAQFILSLFPTRPKVINDDDFKYVFNEEDIQFLNKEGQVYTSQVRSSFSSLYTDNYYAVMGNVAYGFKLSDTDLTETETNLFKRFNSSRKILLKFDIGALGITVSRESLDFENAKHTAKVLGDKIRGAKDEFIANLQTEIDNAESSIVARRILNREDMLMYKNMFSYKGKDIIENREIRIPYKIKTFQRKGWGQIKRGVEITVDDIISNNIRLVVPESKKIGYIGYCEDQVRYARGVTLVFVEAKLSDNQLSRLESLLGAKVEKYVYKRPTTTRQPRDPNAPKVKRQPSKISCKHVFAGYNENGNLTNSERDCKFDLISNDTTQVLYFESVNKGIPVTTDNLSRKELTLLAYLSGKNIIVVRKFKSNEEKIERYKVKRLGEFARETFAKPEVKKQLAEIGIANQLINRYTEKVDSPVIQFTRNNIKSICEKITNLNIFKFTKDADLIRMYADKKYLYKLKQSHKRLVRSSNEKYPLITKLSNNVSSNEIKEYMEMVDFYTVNNGEEK